MVRIVFSDLDRTLLATDKSLPPENLRALDALAERGMEFVPCSGRSVTGLPGVLVRHPACHYAVCANGATVVDARTQEVLHEALLDRSRCVALYERVRDLPVSFDLFADGRIYAERARYDALDGFGIEPNELRLVKGTRTPTDELVPQIAFEVRRLERVTVFWKTPQDRDRVIACVEEDPTLAWTTSSPHDIEISDRAASKGAGLTWLCGHLGIPVADAVAFGDMPNDLSMIRAAGDGVAVSNATPDVLAAADHVTASNDEGGVGTYLMRLLGQR